MHLYVFYTPHLLQFFSCLEGILVGKTVGTPTTKTAPPLIALQPLSSFSLISIVRSYEQVDNTEAQATGISSIHPSVSCEIFTRFHVSCTIDRV